MNFERHIDPKIAMNIGGIDLYAKFLELVPEKNRDKYYDMHNRPHYKWLHYLRKTFLGKTVTFTRKFGINQKMTMKVNKVSITYPYNVHFWREQDNWDVDVSQRIYINDL